MKKPDLERARASCARPRLQAEARALPCTWRPTRLHRGLHSQHLSWNQSVHLLNFQN